MAYQNAVPCIANTVVISDVNKIFTLTCTDNTTVSVTNVQPAGTINDFTLYISNASGDGTNYWTTTFMANTVWSAGTAPGPSGLSSPGVDVLTFWSIDGGLTWNGFPAGIGMA
jgi:hypothetical protein